MLEVYKEDYNEFYRIFNNAIKENKINHAYMFELDDNIDVDLFIKNICKTLVVRNQKDKEYIYPLIDNDNYPNIKVIKTDGMWIKKEQILDIQNDFKKESFDNNLKIYVIEDASKLNKSSANTLLKFLEEPEDNIIAILLTKNKYSVIETIISRCFNVSLKKKIYMELNSDDDSYKFIEILEKYKEKALPYLYQLILNQDYDRKELMTVLENVQKIYSDILHINNNIEEKCNYFTKESLENIDYNSDNTLLIKKVEAINNNMKFLDYNVNIKTVLDKIIIEVYGGE